MSAQTERVNTMSRIVGIGANVCDTLYTVSCYPTEDTKMRATEVVQSGGGPCATGLVPDKNQLEAVAAADVLMIDGNEMDAADCKST